ncbi:MAG: Omp28-related outer membrane protein [Candidatus Zixiibacteriota bacterium]
MTKRIITAILLCILVMAAFSAPRRVMYEHFTSTTCGPCATLEPHLETLIGGYDDDEIVHVDYHVSWPGTGSYFYHPNPEPIDQVRTYYDVTGVPDMFFDAESPETDMDLFAARIDEQLAEDAPIDIEIIPEDGSFHVTIDVEDPQTGSSVLRLYITESDIDYDAANGLTHFNNVFRDAYPDMDGTPVDLSSVTTLEMDIPYTIDGSWNPANLMVVGFVQNTSSKEIYNAAEAHIPAPGYLFSLSAESEVVSDMADAEEIVMYGTLNNVGTEDDSYQISFAGDYSEDWLVSWCSGELCLPEGGTCSTYVASGADEELSVHVSPMDVSGTGHFHLIVESISSDQIDTLSFTLNALSGGGDVLLVADEQNTSGEDIDNSPYYTRVLDALGVDYEIYDRDDGPIAPAYFASFNAIIWYTGAVWSDIFDADDMALVEDYLTTGGNLLMSSSELAWDMVANEDETAWYETYFHNSFDPDADDGASNTAFSGIVAPYEDISSNLIEIEEGNGSYYHDIMHPATDATAILRYDGTSEDAGLIWSDDVTRLAYLGFGMEYMETDAERQALMELLLVEYLLEDVKETIVDVPEDFEIVGNYPNPFNPATEIEYRLDKAGEVLLQIFDAYGREIITLQAGQKEAGSHKVQWHGIDQNGKSMPSGIYLMKLTIENETAAKSLILTK